jgi:hypothetical protein
MRIEKVPHGVSVRIEPAEPLAGAPYRQGEPGPGRLTIERRWSDTMDAGGVGGLLAIWGVVALWLVVIDPDPSAWYVALTLVMFGLALLTSYIFVAIKWNTTTFIIDAARLTVRHAPIPMPRNREIPRSDLGEVFYRIIENPDDEWSGDTFALIARLRSGEELELMGRPAGFDVYVFVAEQLSGYLERTRP